MPLPARDAFQLLHFTRPTRLALIALFAFPAFAAPLSAADNAENPHHSALELAKAEERNLGTQYGQLRRELNELEALRGSLPGDAPEDGQAEDNAESIEARIAELDSEIQLKTQAAALAERAFKEAELERIRLDTLYLEWEVANQAQTGGISGWTLGDWLSILALVAALAMMFGVMRWSRGLSPFRGGGAKNREMTVLDRMAIGRQSTLLVIRLRGNDYFIADHPQGVTLLSELPPPAAEKTET